MRLGPAVRPGIIAEQHRRGDVDALVGGRPYHLQQRMVRHDLVHADPVEVERAIGALQRPVHIAGRGGGIGVAGDRTDHASHAEQADIFGKVPRHALAPAGRAAEGERDEHRHGDAQDEEDRARPARADRLVLAQQHRRGAHQAARQQQQEQAEAMGRTGAGRHQAVVPGQGRASAGEAGLLPAAGPNARGWRLRPTRPAPPPRPTPFRAGAA